LSRPFRLNCVISFIFYLYLILHACVQRFDVTENLKILAKFLGAAALERVRQRPEQTPPQACRSKPPQSCRRHRNRRVRVSEQQFIQRNKCFLIFFLQTWLDFRKFDYVIPMKILKQRWSQLMHRVGVPFSGSTIQRPRPEFFIVR
jgi:hypothetical protein